eukprot:jgi/Mesen1/4922/ME000246S04145
MIQRVCNVGTKSTSASYLREYRRLLSNSPRARKDDKISGTSVALWGNADFGRLGLGDDRSREVPTVCGALDKLMVRQVACGGAHTLVLTDEGRVFAMGLNDCGQLASSPSTPYLQAGLPPSLLTLPFAYSLQQDCHGCVTFCTEGNCLHLQKPVEVEGLPGGARYVAAGHHHSACITDDGRLYMWGANSAGQLGVSAGRGSQSPWQPARVAELAGERVAQVALGAQHTVALTEEGDVLTWGAGGSGRLGHGRPTLFQRLAGRFSERVPTRVRTLENLKISQVAAGHAYTACIQEGGQLFTFGSGRFWQLGLGHERDAYAAQLVDDLPPLADVACGGSHMAAVTLSGEVYSWGANQHGCLGLGKERGSYTGVPSKVEGALLPLSVTQVACGWKHTAALTASGQIYTWGWGGSQGSYSTDGLSSGGQLGLGNEFDYEEPTRVLLTGASGGSIARPLRAVQLSCGFNHTAALLLA